MFNDQSSADYATSFTDRLTVETPEQIDLAYDVAGIGARFMAAIIDHTLIGLILSLGCAILATLLNQLGGFDETVLAGLFGIGIYLVLCGYYILFETIWNGQTPGKRVVGLRVVRTGGRPIGFLGSAIRNIVRLVDFLPFVYGVAMLVMFLDRRARRLGDMAAGALTIKEQRVYTLESLTAGPRQSALVGPIAERIDIPNLHVITPADYQLIQEYLSQRGMFSLDARRRLSSQLVQGLQTRLGFPIYDDPQALVLRDPERFLLLLVAQYNALHVPPPPSPSVSTETTA